MRRLVLLALPLLITGCSSTFYTSKFDPANWKATGAAVEGVVYYEPHQVRLTYIYTALVNKDGKHLGTADDGACRKVIWKEEFIVEPNFREPRVLLNSPGIFSTNKLTVSFANGMITSLNSESTPKTPELLKEVSGLLKEAGAFPLGQPDPNAACNAAPVITRSAVSN